MTTFEPATVSVVGSVGGVVLQGVSKIPLFLGEPTENVGILTIFRRKIIKNHKNHENGQNDHFLAVGKSAKIDVFSRPGSRNEFVHNPL